MLSSPTPASRAHPVRVNQVGGAILIEHGRPSVRKSNLLFTRLKLTLISFFSIRRLSPISVNGRELAALCEPQAPPPQVPLPKPYRPTTRSAAVTVTAAAEARRPWARALAGGDSELAQAVRVA